MRKAIIAWVTFEAAIGFAWPWLIYLHVTAFDPFHLGNLLKFAGVQP